MDIKYICIYCFSHQIIDDIYHNDVNTAWRQLQTEKVIHNLYDCWFPGTNINFAIGYFN